MKTTLKAICPAIALITGLATVTSGRAYAGQYQAAPARLDSVQACLKDKTGTAWNIQTRNGIPIAVFRTSYGSAFYDGSSESMEERISFTPDTLKFIYKDRFGDTEKITQGTNRHSIAIIANVKHCIALTRTP
jgi:hypothetical protein